MRFSSSDRVLEAPISGCTSASLKPPRLASAACPVPLVAPGPAPSPYMIQDAVTPKAVAYFSATGPRIPRVPFSC